jgi:hypothetical protein
VPFRSSLLVSLICATVLVTSVTRANAITRDQLEFFRKCVANGGNMDSAPEKK